MKVFVAWMVDHLDGLIATALMSDNVEELRRASQDLRRAADNVKAWAMAVGGAPILDLGSLGSVEVPADRMTELPSIAKKFEDLTDGTLSVGIGMSLSEAHSAMRYSSIHGGNQISLYHSEMEDALQEVDTPAEPDQLAELGKAQKTGSEEPTGFAEGPDDQPQAGAPTDPQHGEKNPAEGKPVPAGGPQMDAAQAPAPDENGGSMQTPEGGEQQQGGEQDPRAAVIQALQQIKQQAAVLEQLKQTNPEAFEAVKNVVGAMILMAQGMAAGEDVQKSERALKKAEGDIHQQAHKVADSKLAAMDDNSRTQHALQIGFPTPHEWIKRQDPYSFGLTNSKGMNMGDPRFTAAWKGARDTHLHEHFRQSHIRDFEAYRATNPILEKGDVIPFPGNPSPKVDLGANAQVKPMVEPTSCTACLGQANQLLDKHVMSGQGPVGSYPTIFHAALGPGAGEIFAAKIAGSDLSDQNVYNEAHRSLSTLLHARHAFAKAALPMPDPTPKGQHHEYPMGTAKDGRVKVEHKDLATHAATGTAWHSVRAGQVMSEDGHAVSSRNPNGK